MSTTITRDQLKQKMNEKRITVVEALSAESYGRAHLPGAVNLPPDKVESDAPTLLPDKTAEIAVYCSNFT